MQYNAKTLLGVIFASATFTMAAYPMNSEVDFSDAELLRAFAVVAGSEEAKNLLSQFRPGVAHSGDSDWSSDLLIVLSLLGPETNQKVDRYRRARLIRTPPDQLILLEKEWSETREALRLWVETRISELDEAS